MKDFIITVEFFGLTGAYRSRIQVRAKNTRSAETKARKHFGNRDGSIISIVEALSYGGYADSPCFDTGAPETDDPSRQP
jgi:hypothetical protein